MEVTHKEVQMNATAEKVVARLEFLKAVVPALEKLVLRRGRNTYEKVRDASTHIINRLDQFGDGFTIEVESGIYSFGNGHRVTVWRNCVRIFEVKWSLELELADSQLQVTTAPAPELEEKLRYLAQHWEEIVAEQVRQEAEYEIEDLREEHQREREEELKKAAQKLGVS